MSSATPRSWGAPRCWHAWTGSWPPAGPGTAGCSGCAATPGSARPGCWPRSGPGPRAAWCCAAPAGRTPARRPSGSGRRCSAGPPRWCRPRSGASGPTGRAPCSTPAPSRSTTTPAGSRSSTRSPASSSCSAARQPVVLVLDDLHWVDAGSLQLLGFLTADPGARPLLVACGWREHDQVPDDSTRTLVDELAARGESWLLEGLEEADVRRAAGGHRRACPPTSTRPARSRPGPAATRCSSREMARLSRARDASLGGVVPGTAQATTRRRVARLAQPAERSPLRRGGARRLPLLGAAGPAARRTPGRAGAARRHPRRRRADAHRRRPARLHPRADPRRGVRRPPARPGAGSSTSPWPAARARRGRRAGPPPGPRAAAGRRSTTSSTRTERAARAAAAVQAWEDAVRWCDRALELAEPHVPPACRAGAPGRRDAARGRRRRRRPGALRGGRRHSAARRAIPSWWPARRSASPPGSPASRSGCGTAPRPTSWRSRCCCSARRTPRCARRCWRGCRWRSPSPPRSTAAASLAEDAVAMARRLGEPAALAGALAAHCDTVSGPAYAELREAEATEIVELARRVPDVGLELLGLRMRVMSRWERGEMAAAGARPDGVRAPRRPAPAAVLLLVRRALARRPRPPRRRPATRWRRAPTRSRGSAELGGSRNAEVLSVVQRVWPCYERNRPDEAAAIFNEVFGDMPELAGDGGSWYRLFPGRPEAVLVAALPELPEMLAALPMDAEWVSSLGAAVREPVAARHRRRARPAAVRRPAAVEPPLPGRRHRCGAGRVAPPLAGTAGRPARGVRRGDGPPGRGGRRERPDRGDPARGADAPGARPRARAART